MGWVSHCVTNLLSHYTHRNAHPVPHGLPYYRKPNVLAHLVPHPLSYHLNANAFTYKLSYR